MDNAPKPFIRTSKQLLTCLSLIKAAKIIKAPLCDTLSAIAMHWNPRGEVFPSQDRIAALSCIHRRTVITHVKKLREHGVITTDERENASFSQYRPSLNYSFNDSLIKTMTQEAKKTLKAKARNTLAAARLKQSKDHTPAPKNDHSKQSLPLQANDEPKKNTVKKKSLNGILLESILEAIQHELSHTKKLAYQSATKAKQIIRGEIFSTAELARRKAKADRMRAKHEAAADIQRQATDLASNLMTDSAISPVMTDSKVIKLLELIGGEQNLSSYGALLPFKLKAYRERGYQAA